MKDIVYYKVNWEGSTDLGNVLMRQPFESMDEAITYVEEGFKKFREYHKSMQVLHEHTDRWELGYTHQFVIVQASGFYKIISLYVKKEHLYLEKYESN